MPLSPHEERALAALEKELHADDPKLAATLAATPPARRAFRPSATTAIHALSLVAALGVLIAVGTLAGNRPVILAVVTVALLVPWLAWTAQSSGRRPGARRGHPGVARSTAR